MTWEISHTAEAWEVFAENLASMDHAWLAAAVATAATDHEEQVIEEENHAHWDEEDWEDLPFDWSATYETKLAELQHLSHADLEDQATRWCEHWNSCSNGGYDFYIDKDGFYTVPV